MSQPIVIVPTASLHGKVAVVTGASRGIGKGIATELARRGASVVVNYLSSKAGAEQTVDEIHAFKNGAKAVALQADVSRIPEIEALFQAAKAHFGRIDIVMSNSGTESWCPTEDITEDDFDHVFSLNAKAQFFVGQAAYRYCEPGGRLVLMSSIAAGLMGVKNHALYNSSKMAVIGMVRWHPKPDTSYGTDWPTQVKAFATDFGCKNITVNAVAPGGIKSDMFAQNAWHYIPGGQPDWPAEKIEHLMAEHCPLKRCAETVDVARVVAFLVSEDGGWVNGQVITISGGSSQ